MGVNFCQPPLLPPLFTAPPPSRPLSALTELPGRGTEPQPEFPRGSLVERVFSFAPKPRDPPFELRLEFTLPGRALSLWKLDTPLRAALFVFSNPRWLPFAGETPFCRMALLTCACSRSNELKERPLAAVVVPRDE